MKLSIEEPTGEPYVPMVYDITPNQWVYQIEADCYTVWGEERYDGYLITGVYNTYYDHDQGMIMMQFLYGADDPDGAVEDDFLLGNQSMAIHEVAGALVEWMQQRDEAENVPAWNGHTRSLQ